MERLLMESGWKGDNSDGEAGGKSNWLGWKKKKKRKTLLLLVYIHVGFMFNLDNIIHSVTTKASKKEEKDNALLGK